MNRTGMKIIAVGALTLSLAFQSVAADVGRIIRSSAFPGMGQLGDDQKARGLLYMGGEIVLLALTVDQVVRKASYDRATVYDSVKVELALTYEEKAYWYNDWQDMVDKSERAQKLSLVFGGAAAVWWVWNIVDAVLFGPKDKEEARLYEKVKENTHVTVWRDKASLSYSFSF